MNIIKPTANAIVLTTANNFANATCVYVATTATAFITVAYANSVTKGAFVLPANQYIFVQKDYTDTIASNVAVSASAAAYRG